MLLPGLTMPIFDDDADLECPCPVAAGTTLAVRDEVWTRVAAGGITFEVDEGFVENSGGNAGC